MQVLEQTALSFKEVFYLALDFKLDDKGDFILSTPPLYPKLKLSWVDSNRPVLRINFEQGQECATRQLSNRLCVSFKTTQSEQTMNRKFSTVSGKDELRQRIMIRLRTEKGEVRLLKTLGSYVMLQKHEDIMSDTTKQILEDVIMAEVADILQNPKVVVLPKRTTGPFFCQNINAYIYEDNDLVYTISL